MSLLRLIKQHTNHTVILCGKGEFAKAFRSVDDSTVVFILTKDTDHVKEILTHVNSIYVPSMETVESELYYRGEYYTLYKTTYSAPLTKEHTMAYTQWQILAKTWSNVNKPYKTTDWYIATGDFIDMLREEAAIDEELIDAIDIIYSWATAYGPNFMLEFPKRNVGVNADGILQLRDIVFFR